MSPLLYQLSYTATRLILQASVRLGLPTESEGCNSYEK